MAYKIVSFDRWKMGSDSILVYLRRSRNQSTSRSSPWGMESLTSDTLIYEVFQHGLFPFSRLGLWPVDQDFRTLYVVVSQPITFHSPRSPNSRKSAHGHAYWGYKSPITGLISAPRDRFRCRLQFRGRFKRRPQLKRRRTYHRGSTELHHPFSTRSSLWALRPDTRQTPVSRQPDEGHLSHHS